MEESIESKWLLNNWNSDTLGRYKNQWVAVLGERIIANAESFTTLSNILTDYRDNNLRVQKIDPLFAFIYFGRLQ
jgi:hypothetical protein